MKNLNTILLQGTVYNNVSLDLNNYDTDDVGFALTNQVDYIYTGLYKNFKNIYVEVVENTISGNMSFEYFNGATWQALEVSDETKNLTRSGFIRWEKTLSAESVNGNTLFYIRMTGDVTGTLAGINMIFANDNDLRENYRQINDYLGSDSSYIAIHQAVRKDIIQDIRNSGNIKISTIDGMISDLTIWDFLQPNQLRNAATYLALSKIFWGVSDSTEGKFHQLATSYKKRSTEALNVFMLTVDKSDDGVKDKIEAYESVTRTRVIQV